MSRIQASIVLSLFVCGCAFGQDNPVPLPPSFVGESDEDPVLDHSSLKEAFDSLSIGQHTNYVNGEQKLLNQADLAWQTECHYFAGGQKIDVFGKPANNNQAWRHIQFDESTATWIDKTSNGNNSPATINTSGHVYGNSTINSANGDLFLLSGNEGSIRHYRRATDDWVRIASGGWTTTSQKNGLAYHPNLFGAADGGLVMGTATYIWLWRESTDTWVQLKGYGASGTKEGIGVYQPVGDYVLLKGRSTNLYKIPAGSGGKHSTPINLGTPPINTGGLSGNSTSGTVLTHPDGSNKLVLIENWNGSDRWWISADEGDSWALQSADHGLHGGSPTTNGLGGPFCSIPEYGGVIAISENDARVWKP